MDRHILITTLLASLLLVAVIVLGSRRPREPAYWTLSWGMLLLSGIILVFDPGPVPRALAIMLSGAFLGLQVAGAYAYAGRAVPGWAIPGGIAVGILRAILAVAGFAETSHAVVLPFELAMLAWSGRVILGARTVGRPAIDWILAIGALGLCGLEAADAVRDISSPVGSVSWGPWITAGLALGITQIVGTADRFQRGIFEERLAREEHESTAQRLESLGVLAGGIAHDFNNHLTNILGNTELAMAELREDDPLRQILGDVLEGALAAAELSAQMLAYANVERLSPQPVDLSEVLNSSRNLLRSGLDESIDLRFDAPPELPEILADRNQLDQVIANLVINAGEACAVGGHVKVSVALADLATATPMPVIGVLGSRRYLRLRISDSGCGVASGDVERIFDPFFSTKFAGRGLGLAVTQRMVLAHEGAIVIDSTPEGGTRFDVYFPVTDEAAAEVSVASQGRGWRTRQAL